MKIKYIILFIVFYTGIILPLHGEIPEFRKIIEDYLSVNTIKASITQEIYLEDGTTEVFSGNYFSSSSGFIRIDYIRPERQTVVVNDAGLFWYYSDRKLLFKSEKKNTNTDSIPLLMNSIPPESLREIEIISEGMKFYSFFKMADVYSITSKKNKTKMLLWIEPVSKIIKRKIILDESGREMMKEEYTEHTLVNGVYIPSKIELNARTTAGVVHTVTEYENLVINTRPDKDLFKFKITSEMKVRDLSGR